MYNRSQEKGGDDMDGVCNKEKGRDIWGITLLIQLMTRATLDHIFHICHTCHIYHIYHPANVTHGKGHPESYISHIFQVYFSLSVAVLISAQCTHIATWSALCNPSILFYLCMWTIVVHSSFFVLLFDFTRVCVNDFIRVCEWVVLYHPLFSPWTLHPCFPVLFQGFKWNQQSKLKNLEESINMMPMKRDSVYASWKYKYI